jgi:hypothetical protein
MVLTVLTIALSDDLEKRFYLERHVGVKGKETRRPVWERSVGRSEGIRHARAAA